MTVPLCLTQCKSIYMHSCEFDPHGKHTYVTATLPHIPPVQKDMG